MGILSGLLVGEEPGKGGREEEEVRVGEERWVEGEVGRGEVREGGGEA